MGPLTNTHLVLLRMAVQKQLSFYIQYTKPHQSIVTVSIYKVIRRLWLPLIAIVALCRILCSDKRLNILAVPNSIKLGSVGHLHMPSLLLLLFLKTSA